MKEHGLQRQSTTHWSCVFRQVSSLSSFSHLRDIERIQWVDICEALHASRIVIAQWILSVIVNMISDINIRRHLFLKYNLCMSQSIFYLGSLCTWDYFQFFTLETRNFHSEFLCWADYWILHFFSSRETVEWYFHCLFDTLGHNSLLCSPDSYPDLCLTPLSCGTSLVVQ